ncbi:MAG TPA: SRPBCC family protein [Pyrinomonadaceae bacterium]|jgi:ligand-binding SRPBCC domain-containing protein
MPIIEIEVEIYAPIERVFDLARCIDLHAETMSRNNEKAIGGVTKGLINLGETVTWQATHFGIRQKLTSKITAYNRPFHFQDVMLKGAFKRFTHEHFFEQKDAVVLMKDVFDYDSPFWIPGKIADALFLKNYMKNLLTERNLLIKKIAESEDWRKFLA